MTGGQVLDLSVGDGGDGNGNDHGDWAIPTLTWERYELAPRASRHVIPLGTRTARPRRCIPGAGRRVV